MMIWLKDNETQLIYPIKIPNQSIQSKYPIKVPNQSTQSIPNNIFIDKSGLYLYLWDSRDNKLTKRNQNQL